ncbi:MAG: PAS domain S-box protein [Nitrospiraceae bacterium]
MQQSEARFRNVVEMAPAGMIVLDSEERIILVNAALEKIFGYSREELLGKTVDLLLPDDVRRNHGEAVRSFFRNPAARTMGAGRDLRGRCKDGRMVFVEIGLSPIDTIQGMAVLASVVDITERKRIERLGEGQRAILESIEKGSALSDTLTMLCRVIEGQADGLFCTILLRDGDRLGLLRVPACRPSTTPIGDIVIGPTAGSCGTAALPVKPS